MPYPVFQGKYGISPSFVGLNETPGVDQLPASITSNGVSVAPEFRYKGGDADATDWDPWTYGSILTPSAAGSLAFNQGSPLLGTNDDSILFDGTNHYLSPNNTLGNITSEDFIIEIIYKPTLTAATLAWKVEDTTNHGWSIYQLNTGILRLSASDTGVGGGVVSSASASIATGYWVHAMIFVNSSEASANGAQWYFNGVANGSGADINYTSLTAAKAMRIGAGGTAFDSNVAYVAMYKQSNWFASGASGPTSWASIAKERSNRLFGLYSTIGSPTTSSRSSIGSIDKVEGSARKIYNVSANWIRSCKRTDDDSTSVNGVLIENQVQNKSTNSEAFGSWGSARVAIDSNATSAPDGETTADGLIADANDNVHYVNQAHVLDATKWTYSIFAKKGNKDWINLVTAHQSKGAFFDLNNGVAANISAGITAKIESYGDGWYRCSITFTGTTGNANQYVYLAHSINDNTFAGDASTTSGYLWGSQMENNDYPTSYISAGGAAVTRSADVLKYSGSEIGSIGAIACDVLFPDVANLSNKYVFSANDGGSSADVIAAFVDTNSFMNATMRASAGDDGDVVTTTDIFDNVLHSVRATWQSNLLTAYVDGTSEGTPDTDCDVPDDIDGLFIGTDESGANYLNGLIKSLVIFPKPTKKEI